MDSKYIFSTLIFISASLYNAIDAESCIAYCGEEVLPQVTCPSGYTCEKLGCDIQCLRTGQYQPQVCPMVKCMAISCPLGFIRYADGCEGCTCANQTLVDAIRNSHNSAAQFFSCGLYLLTALIISVFGKAHKGNNSHDSAAQFSSCGLYLLTALIISIFSIMTN